ncbi:MAG: hypothetical protein KIT68_02520 [Phycisphaeraceae bacterium]|nr:hypothetical protein [Phycisphaeraceae bacterium]
MRRRLIALMCPVVFASAGALGQTVTLNNSSLPFPTGQANLVPEPGFGPGEIAAATFDIPQDLLPIRVTSVSVMWYSTFYSIFGPQPPTAQEDILIYRGMPPNVVLIGSADTPQMQDGGWNLFSFAQGLPDDLIITTGTKLTVGIRMDMTPLNQNGQAPAGNALAAAPAYDTTSTTQKRNPVFLTSTVNTVNGPRTGWMDYNDIVQANGQRRSTQGWDLGLVVTIEHYEPPTPPCPADLATEGSSDPLSGPDGFITGTDFDVFVQGFFTELRRGDNSLLADLTDDQGSGGPDGFVTGADFDFFVIKFFEGCP